MTQELHTRARMGDRVRDQDIACPRPGADATLSDTKGACATRPGRRLLIISKKYFFVEASLVYFSLHLLNTTQSRGMRGPAGPAGLPLLRRLQKRRRVNGGRAGTNDRRPGREPGISGPEPGTPPSLMAGGLAVGGRWSLHPDYIVSYICVLLYTYVHYCTHMSTIAHICPFGLHLVAGGLAVGGRWRSKRGAFKCTRSCQTPDRFLPFGLHLLAGGLAVGGLPHHDPRVRVHCTYVYCCICVLLYTYVHLGFTFWPEALP
jgi:hypothetical protein